MSAKVMRRASLTTSVLTAMSQGPLQAIAHEICPGGRASQRESARVRTSLDVTAPRFLSAGLFLSLSVVASASAQTGSTAPPLEVIVARMAHARAENQARLRPYVVTRSYTLFGKERHKPKSEVTAEVTFAPPNSKEYSIRKGTGSGLGERIVRRMLEAETQIVKDYNATDISPANYDFSFVRDEDVADGRCYVLELLPRREDKTLLRGNMWVDAHTYLLRRMEVEPARRPSWWLRNVRISFFYGDVAGMWLQTASEFTTNVRIFGRHTMTSRDVKYDTAGLAGAGLSGPGTLPPSGNRNEQHCAAPCTSLSLQGIQSGEGEYPYRAN